MRRAVDGRLGEVRQSGVVERHPYGAGLLQLEYRANPKTGTRRGPYWYYHYREGGRQRTLYVGKTGAPEAAVGEKLAGRESTEKP
ncbi:MAG: hypothetical protein M3Q49_22230 [Actinomycetota bacterium]|nr:hypothetical protein [Actinomycetota bacterium]